jgi:hypothetical protein
MNLIKPLAFAIAILSATSHAKAAVQKNDSYPLPLDVRQSLKTLANDCDLLVVGEVHGTKEVPAIVEALLPTLTKLGYRTLALEIPRDEQPAIAAWATGEFNALPRFFGKPGPDGRGNEQVLALVRRALRPPYEWNLICFDQTDEEFTRQMKERLPKEAKRSIAERAAKLTPDDVVALSVERDATMAKHLAAAREKLPASHKVIALCGNVHARTKNHAPPESPLKPLWPSFAASLQQNHPQWQIRSINVQAFSGEYFNNGQVNKFSERPLAQIEARPTPNADWHWQLNLPRATAATFLVPPE